MGRTTRPGMERQAVIRFSATQTVNGVPVKTTGDFDGEPFDKEYTNFAVFLGQLAQHGAIVKLWKV